MTKEPESVQSPEAATVEPPDELVELTEPADGLPDLITTPAALEAYVAKLQAATGAIAVDAERASGFKYGNQNYLIQLRRQGAGTALIDPIAVPDLSGLSPVLNSTEWVLHAASQDLPSLATQGLKPPAIFDTELAGRLLGMPRVGLGTVVAELLGLRLAKEHSAADWSTRPLPVSWLRYAALDVEVLLELREIMSERLLAAGKSEWAFQEFEHVRLAEPPAPRTDPWRRTSHITELKSRRQLAIARSLWYARDKYAQRRDTAPGRALPDRAIIAAAKAAPRSVPELSAVREFSGRAAKSRIAYWQQAISAALTLPEAELPPLRAPRTDTPPHPKSWADRHPQAAQRLDSAKPLMQELAETHHLPLENLLQPDALRRLCWHEPFAETETEIRDFLQQRGARPWQLDLVSPALAQTWASLETAPKPASN